MTPATLLLHDEGREWVAYLREEATGHGALLRRALRSRTQVCHPYPDAEDAEVALGSRPGVGLVGVWVRVSYS